MDGVIVIGAERCRFCTYDTYFWPKQHRVRDLFWVNFTARTWAQLTRSLRLLEPEAWLQ